jgi:hypothetical protein
MIATTDTLAETDWLLIQSGNKIEDVSGNAMMAGTYTAIGNDEANDMSGFGSSTTIHGLGGNDTIVGSAQADTINGGDGADTIIGYGGADKITGSTGADTILIGVWNGPNDYVGGGEGHTTIVVNTGDSPLGQGTFDHVLGFGTTVAAANDLLDLPSNVIKADGTIDIDNVTVGDVTIGKVVVNDGIATFALDDNTAVTLNAANFTNAQMAVGQALANNSTVANGETVAFAWDNGTNQGTSVFQGNSDTDILVALVGTTGVTALDTLYVDHHLTIA